MKKNEEPVEAEVIKVGKEEEEEIKVEHKVEIDSWKPRTKIGERVKNKEITNIDEILDNGLKINESQIVDALLPDMETELLLLGQSKGKFGGGKRRAFRQTQKKTNEGNKPKFSTVAVIGNNNGYVGVGFGKSKETVPAREKALRQAKISLIKISRGCGSWQCDCRKPHTLPFAVEGKSGSVVVTLTPAPKGTGLVAEAEIAKILIKAGIVDAWSKARGKTSSRSNLIRACVDALRKTTSTHTLISHKEKLGLVEGKYVKKEEVQNE